jgi:hypothetical protein
MFSGKITHFTILLPVFYLMSCSSTKPWPKAPAPLPVPTADTVRKAPVMQPVDDAGKTDSFMEGLLKEHPEYFGDIMKDRKELNVQIIYTQIDRGANGMPALKNHYFNVNPDRYFYPASTVKFPVSLLALQRLNELKGKGIDKNSTMITEAAYSGQTAVLNDPTTTDGRPCIAHYIKKILMVSDNDAYNRLYEFLGPQYINEQLHKKGYSGIQLRHRLQIALSEEENRHTNPVRFLNANNEVLYEQPMQYDETKYADRNDSIGRGYYAADKLVEKPMDFSVKNRISLEDLHTILISLVFPNKVPSSQRISLTEEDRNFVLKYMSQLPTESTYPPYSSDTANYYPAYCKFLLYGSEKGPLPQHIRMFNKVGDAYGQLLDVAYIVDFDKKIEFFLSAVIYCNSDGVLNDDKYDYDNLGFPFMKHLGQVIYEHELRREKKILPDLSHLLFEYDRK